MSVSAIWRSFAAVIPVATAALLMVPGEAYGEAHGVVSAAEGEAVQLDAFGVAVSRTIFLPAPPDGQVTVQLKATAVDAGIPGEFKFYLAAPEASDVFTTVAAEMGQTVPTGQELANGIAFVDPGKFYAIQVGFENPTDDEIRFLVSAPLIDPAAALPFARAQCWCAAIPFSAPPRGAFYRTIRVGVAANTPPGVRVIVEWPVISVSE